MQLLLFLAGFALAVLPLSFLVAIGEYNRIPQQNKFGSATKKLNDNIDAGDQGNDSENDAMINDENRNNGRGFFHSFDDTKNRNSLHPETSTVDGPMDFLPSFICDGVDSSGNSNNNNNNYHNRYKIAFDDSVFGSDVDFEELSIISGLDHIEAAYSQSNSKRRVWAAGNERTSTIDQHGHGTLHSTPSKSSRRGIRTHRLITGMLQASDPTGKSGKPSETIASVRDLYKYVRSGRNAIAVSTEWPASSAIVASLRSPRVIERILKAEEGAETNVNKKRDPGRSTISDFFPDCKNSLERTDSNDYNDDNNIENNSCLAIIATVCGGKRSAAVEEVEARKRHGEKKTSVYAPNRHRTEAESRARAVRLSRRAKIDVEKGINSVLKRTRSTSLAVVHLHWHDSRDIIGIRAAAEYIVDERLGKDVNQLGLANAHWEVWGSLLRAGIPVLTNEVPFSIIDDRAASKLRLISKATGYRAKIIPYGILCGGLLTDRYLGVPRPVAGYVTPSVNRYLKVVDAWGGWGRFQNLLSTLRMVADRHGVGIAEIAIRYVLERPYVASVILGVRLGLASHIEESNKVFTFELSLDDYRDIRAASKAAPGRSLIKKMGHPGDEYQAHRSVPDHHAHIMSHV